jgi:hypothetical protein|tara:strand:+ start:230 stop:502 length:273 start_codon:yes stop_codon:yes gene_type:complete
VVEVVVFQDQVQEQMEDLVAEDLQYQDQEDQVIHLQQVHHKEIMVELEEHVELMTVVVAEVDLVALEEMQLHPKQETVEQEQQTILQEVV